MNLLLLSTSTVFGGNYLAYAKNDIQSFFAASSKVLFVPFARPSGISNEEYTAKAKDFFKSIDIECKGANEFYSVLDAMNFAQGIFTGGGNTFLLLKTLYETGYYQAIKESVQDGMPYMGSSAGSNMAGLTIGTTNDMPIVYPPSFNAYSFLPFNLNPHYLDPIEGSTHMGETRETRINEFHHQNVQPVLGLREGSWLHRSGNNLVVNGELSVRLFQKDEAPIEIATGSNLNFLL